jgi:DNA polymerase III delta subunit
MKIFVIHGEHSLNSYERLQEYIKRAKSKKWEIKYYENGSNGFKNEILGQSLFSEKRLIIIKDIKLLSKSNTKWLQNNQERVQCNLIIYHKASIPKRTINSLPKTDKIEEFKIPKLIWSFLDSFFPRNAKNCYKLFHEVIKKEAIEFVFAMLARQVRDIYWAKVDSKTMDYPSWRLNKLKKQASRFSKKDLENIIEDMSNADIKSKTSHTNLEKSLDFIIAKYLE